MSVRIQDQGTPRIRVARDPDTLLRHLGAWRQLAVDAVEPNVFYEPVMLLPALRHLAGDAVEVVLVFVSQPDGRADRLVGLFPLERASQHHGLPVATLRPWQHVHCFLTTPLVARDSLDVALDAFVEHLVREQSALLEWGALGAEGPVYEALLRCLDRRGLPHRETGSFERAVLERGADAREFVETHVRKSRRKGLRRNRRKLAELGHLRTRRLGVDDDLELWLETFLALEAAGWKGREGTAMRSVPAERRFFLESAIDAARNGQLSMLALALDHRFIAMQCIFRASGPAGASFSFKMAYDEEFARFGPGLLIEIDYIEAFHDDPDLRWEDSCCGEPGSPVEEFWQGRRRIVSLEASISRGVGRLIAHGMPLLRNGLRWGRRWRSRRAA